MANKQDDYSDDENWDVWGDMDEEERAGWEHEREVWLEKYGDY